MRRFYFPTKDVTLYQEFSNRQTGLDEVLEVGKSIYGQYIVRSLLEFDMATISASIANGTIPKYANFDFTLFLAKAERLELNQGVDVHLVSSSWVEGSGYFYQDTIESYDGATWQLRAMSSSWYAVSSSVSGGGDYYSASVSSSTSTQTPQPMGDLTFSITPFVQMWVSGTIPNYGMLVKLPDESETTNSNRALLKFFSRNTHTVFSPVMVAKWDDSIYHTSSWTSASSDALTVFPVNLRPEYKQGELARIDIAARELWPMKTFTTQFEAWKNRYLPTTSYYSIVDVQSQEVIIPFDDNSKISVDSDSNYVMFVVDKMFPRRYYKMMFKVVFPDGHQYIFDEHYNFTVTL